MPAASALSAAKTKSSALAGEGDWWHEPVASVTVTQQIEDVAIVWRELETGGIESPGQSLDFTRAWIEKFRIPASRQLYVTGSFRGKAVALLPLVRNRARGLNILTWFAGSHVGCNAPLVDHAALSEMSTDERAEFWRTIQRGFSDADLVCLDAVPEFAGSSNFDGLGAAWPAEQLYRSEFDTWEECDRIQRTRSRRKHDRQQGAKLEAMGDVTFEELASGPEAASAVQTMFRQKSMRFREWGVDDPFADPNVQNFYAGMLGRPGALQARLHVLRLDGEIVAVRYNLVHGDRVFALISSMDPNPDLSPGSPGKQNLLRAQMHMFSTGMRMVDMGAGFSDEKRHWCNVSVQVRDHLVPLTARGRVAAKVMGWKSALLRRIKADRRLFNLAKNARAAVARIGNRR